MLFHVLTKVQPPPGADPEEIERLFNLEHAHAVRLQHQGKWLHLWRVVGQWTNISIFRVETPDELHEILRSLPLHPYSKTKVTALCRHPGSLADAD